MSAQTTEAFRKAVMMMRLLKSSTVVVGLSGSSDSVALAYLAKQTFAKVLAMTVNLK
ncbi:hypothetical protein GBAR_LOCUS26930 [Geodia barretti]|uniref:NAD/GMP synthase domain-containing protein n=1 Tax=Geodia barretti TaxID=519541 RepID=A0AA35TIF7_GEOBA|nr:hypothetical protein GBAR_LOCUS26930 [Geodia barretti]